MIALFFLTLLLQDGGEPGTGTPVSSIGRTIPSPVRMTGACLALTLSLACADKPLTFSPPHPTWQEIEQLAAHVPAKVGKRAPRQSAFEVRVYPPLILAGSGTWLTCAVPERYYVSADPETPAPFRKIRVELAGRAFEAPLDHIEHKRFVEHIPCGTWDAVCTITGPNDARESRKATLLAKGECNDDGTTKDSK